MRTNRDSPEERRLVAEQLDLLLGHAFETKLGAQHRVVADSGSLDAVRAHDRLGDFAVLFVAALVLGGEVDAHEEREEDCHRRESEADCVAHDELWLVLGAVDHGADNPTRVASLRASPVLSFTQIKSVLIMNSR